MLREPLVHFLLIGALLLAIGAEEPPADVPGDPVLLEVPRDQLAARFERKTGRAPTPSEARALADTWLKEEALYREALRLGLDENDPVIRGRLIEKVRFLAGSSRPAEPSLDALRAHFDAHPARYRTEGTTTLEQQFLKNGKPAPLPIGRTHTARTEAQLAARFGPAFAEAVQTIPVGASATVRSAYGEHRVRVTARAPARSPSLGEVRDRVRKDLLAERREAKKRATLRELTAGYAAR